jgi:hypothetical protein
MNIENKAKEIIDDFRKKILAEADEAISNAYSDILPHVENDTFMNVQYRSQTVIENIIAGKFERINEKSVSVLDDNEITVEIALTDGKWDCLRKSLLSVMPVCPKDLEIQSLKEQLKHAEEAHYL